MPEWFEDGDGQVNVCSGWTATPRMDAPTLLGFTNLWHSKEELLSPQPELVNLHDLVAHHKCRRINPLPCSCCLRSCRSCACPAPLWSIHTQECEEWGQCERS
ncbi:hypothetical protein KC19_11G006500 [Ceratodon purpureus]|uniref:Uncharacterized protein n=1 Tax=Ceratodon purpureus TaxID=3225 RepID=A0A8T0G9R1_CERPU|nr:hypothetical protein KC19_11G006500 [Ceratodon purpureus]